MVALTAVCRDGWEVLRGYEGGGADELTGIDVNNPNVVDVVSVVFEFGSREEYWGGEDLYRGILWVR